MNTVAVDVSEIRKEGYILKESAIIRQYRKRWLVLTRTHLYTFKKDRSYAEPTEVPNAPLRLCPCSARFTRALLGREPGQPRHLTSRLQLRVRLERSAATDSLYALTLALLRPVVARRLAICARRWLSSKRAAPSSRRTTSRTSPTRLQVRIAPLSTPFGPGGRRRGCLSCPQGVAHGLPVSEPVSAVSEPAAASVSADE
jgi:hypothetical protein